MTVYTELLSQGASDQRRLVHVERDQTRAVLALCEPERLNPLSAGLMVQLHAHIMDLTADPSLRTIVITAKTPRSAPEATWT
jgi:2-(1,2-epoxy-1,2-dihydrophenyl)acetyl-CoA isomerase